MLAGILILAMVFGISGAVQKAPAASRPSYGPYPGVYVYLWEVVTDYKVMASTDIRVRDSTIGIHPTHPRPGLFTGSGRVHVRVNSNVVSERGEIWIEVRGVGNYKSHELKVRLSCNPWDRKSAQADGVIDDREAL